MSIVQLVQSLEKYSIDILGLGFLVCAFTSVIKKVVPQRLKKFLTFLPFILGILVYMAYIYIATDSISFINVKIYENGIKCGMMATIYYVLYEQFIRGKTKYPETADIKEIAIAGQLDGIVLESHLKSVSRKIYTVLVANMADKQYCIEYIVSQVKGKEKPAVTDDDIHNVARLIVTSIAVIGV